MKNVLIISEDVVNSKMGGTGVRSWELARTLARHFNLTLAVPNEVELKSEGFRQITYNRTGSEQAGSGEIEQGNATPSLRQSAEKQDVIILQGFTLHFHPYLKEIGVPLAVDLYVPYLLENLVWHDRDNWGQWIPEYEEFLRVQGELIRAGDFFFCASERQRDYWLGWLHAQKRINPHTYRQDPSLRRLIDVVSFGIPGEEPAHKKKVLKGVHPKIAGDDRLIIWSGGMWDWLDPLSLIRAMKILQPNHPELKLYFMGTRHPNPILKGMEMPERAMELSKELGLFDQTVFFGDWAPYDERQSYLLEADLSVITHPDTIETHFSYRTRLLDCLWAKIPVVVSEGDTFADLVVQEGLGVTVPSTPMKTVAYTQSKTANGEGQGDEAKALAQGIEKVLREIQKGGYRDNFERVRERFRWGRTAQPLIAFCQEPSMAVDKGEYQTAVEKLRRDKDAFLEQVVKDKDAYYLAIIQRYQNSLPLRAYYRMKRLLRTG